MIMILMLLFRKEWRILISLSQLTLVHDDIDTFIKEKVKDYLRYIENLDDLKKKMFTENANL